MVVLLSVLGGIMFVAIAGVVISKLPKDPGYYLTLGDEQLERGKISGAEQAYARAVGYSKDAKESEAITLAANARYKLAMLHEQILLDNSGLTKSEWLRRLRSMRSLLDAAVRIDPTHEKSHRKLAELYWTLATSGGGKDQSMWVNYIGIAEKLLAIDPQDHQIYFRKGIAQEALVIEFNKKQRLDGALADFQKAIDIMREIG